MTCESCGDKPKKCNKDFTKAVIEIDNPEQITLMRKVTIPASMGDDTTVPPVVGKYHNVLLYYEANSKSYLYSSDGIPTQLVNGVTDYEAAVNLPQINGVTLLGNKSAADLELADAPMVITVAAGNTSWSGADTAEDVYNFFLNKGKVNIVFDGGGNYAYEIASAAYIPEEEKMMCTLAVATIAAGETAEFEGNALFGTMTLYTADKAIDVSQIELQPKLYVADFTGLDLNYDTLSGVPATNAAIGMVKPGDGLEVASDGTLSISDIEQYAHFFDTVADMKAATNLVAGDYARTGGFHSLNDGGGALYKITDTGTSTTNEMDIIAVGDSLIASLIYDIEFNVKQFGAYGDNTHDDTDIFQYTIDRAYETKIKVINIPEGVYLISRPLEIYENKNYDLNMDWYDHVERHADLGYPVSKLVFQGVDQYNTMLKSTNGDYLFNGYAETPVGIQDLTFNDLFFNGNGVAKTTIQMNVVHFGGREIQFNRCSFNSFTECGVRHWLTGAMLSEAPLRNQFRVYINDCAFSNNKNGLIIGGDDTTITHCQIGKNEEYGIRIYGSFHEFTIDKCKIQYNGQFKTGYTGGQIILQGSGQALNIQDCYIENKSGVVGNNDTGVIILDTNVSTGTQPDIRVFTVENCYINLTGAYTVIEKITDVLLVNLCFCDNFITNLYSDKPYLVTVINTAQGQGSIQKITADNNYVAAKDSTGTTNITRYFLSNYADFTRAGNTNTQYGVWTPNTQDDLVGSTPTIISGMISADGESQYRKLGDYSVSKTGTGVYEITFSRPASLAGLNANMASNYPVHTELKFYDAHDGIKVTNRSINGFTVETGTLNNDFSSFTPADKPFQFIATLLSEI